MSPSISNGNHCKEEEFIPFPFDGTFTLANEEFEPDVSVTRARRTIIDPRCHFFRTRFSNLTPYQQSELLARTGMKVLETASSGGEEALDNFPDLRGAPDALRVKREVLDEQTLAQYYLKLPERSREKYFMRRLEDERTRDLVMDDVFDILKRSFPAVLYILHHIYQGGYIGLLTARTAKDAQEVVRRLAGEALGHEFPYELMYCVNDTKRSARLKDCEGTADKKATVLADFLNGLKFEDGRVVPTRCAEAGIEFDEVIFIDDERENLKEVFATIVASVYREVHLHLGLRLTSEWEAKFLRSRACEMAEEAFDKFGVRIAQDRGFWEEIVKSCISGFPGRSSRAVIAHLEDEGRWFPDRLKIEDGKEIVGIDKIIESLKDMLNDGKRIILGSKRSIVFSDLDGTLMNLKAKMYVRRKDVKGEGTGEVLLTVTSSEWARHPNKEYWLSLAAHEFDVSLDELELDFAQSKRSGEIETSIAAAEADGRHLLAGGPKGLPADAVDL